MALLAPALACLLLQEQPKPRLDLVHPPVATTADRPYQLESERNGLIYRGDHFTAHVAPDGGVRFEDKGGSNFLTPWPSPLPRGTSTLAGMLRGLLSKRQFQTRTRPRPGQPDEPPPQTAIYIQPNRADPRELCQDPSARCFFDQRRIVVQAAVFADWEMLLLGLPGKTPHREEKARFLAATAGLRDRMAQEAHAEDLKAALWDLPALLERVWSANRDTPAEGRRLLYELWSEYTNNSDAAPACATILGFIRRRLPAGSPNAYTNDELAKYKAAGRAGFDPY
jgi:hypothetical protein